MIEPRAATGHSQRREAEIVNDLSQLRALVPHGLAPAPYGRNIRLAFPQVDERQRVVWERRLGRRLRACGCQAGAITVAVVLLAYIVSEAAHGVRFGQGAFANAAVWVGVAVVSSVVAKLAALTWSKLALERLLREIEVRVGKGA